MFNNATRYLPFSLSVWYNVYITADTKGGRTQPGGGGSAKDIRGTLFSVDTELPEPVQAALSAALTKLPRENYNDVNGTANNGGSFVVAHRYDVNEVGRVRHTFNLLPKETELDSIIEFTISFTPNRKECTVTAEYPPEEEGRNISPFPSPRNLRPAQDCSTRFQFDFIESPGGSGHSFRNMTYSRSPTHYDLEQDRYQTLQTPPPQTRFPIIIHVLEQIQNLNTTIEQNQPRGLGGA